MSVNAIQWAFRQDPGSHGAMLVLLSLANHADVNGGCWPSRRLISQEANVGLSTVKAALKTLESQGLLVRQPEFRSGRQTSNKYQLPLDQQDLETPENQGVSLGGQQVSPGGQHIAPRGAITWPPGIVSRNRQPEPTAPPFLPPGGNGRAEPCTESPDTAGASESGEPSTPHTENPATAPASKKRKRAEDEPSESFETVWPYYPKRAGGNPKREAWKAWRARLRDGYTEEELVNGLRRYRLFCRATGKEQTEKVMQAKRFWGPNQLFMETWELPQDLQPQGVNHGNGTRGGNAGAMERIRRLNADTDERASEPEPEWVQ